MGGFLVSRDGWLAAEPWRRPSLKLALDAKSIDPRFDLRYFQAMARELATHRRNFNDPGHAHELTFSCYRGFAFLKAERTCQWLADAIDVARREHNFAVWAYVFMPNYAHIIIYPREQYDIAAIRHAIKEPVGRKAIQHIVQHAPEWLTHITRKRGKKTERLFWQSGGGYDRNIIRSKSLLSMIDYVHRNPLRKKLVERVEDWKWSSAAYFVCDAEIPLAVDPIDPAWLNMDG